MHQGKPWIIVTSAPLRRKSVTYAEPVSSVDDEDVGDASVLAEEVLQVSVSDVVRKVSNEDPSGFP